MYYVYLLRSINTPNKKYIGYTKNLKQRFNAHNIGNSTYTNKNKPWELDAYFAFKCKQRAVDFEKYLKSGSGNAFANKRIWS